MNTHTTGYSSSFRNYIFSFGRYGTFKRNLVLHNSNSSINLSKKHSSLIQDCEYANQELRNKT